jgi:hypothetical protein
MSAQTRERRISLAGGSSMMVRIGKGFEFEWSVGLRSFVPEGSIYLRVGPFARYWNMVGLPSH